MNDRTARTVGIYETHAETFLAQWGRGRYRVPPLLRTLLQTLPERARVLDLGCGPGRDLRFAGTRGYRGVGLDRAFSLLKWAKDGNPALLLVGGDIRSVPFGAGRFQGIWAAASLIHLSKPEVRKTLERLLELVPPGGSLAATFAHGKSSGFRMTGWLPGRYFSKWTKNELLRAATGSGWTVESISVVVNRERKGRWINLLARR